MDKKQNFSLQTLLLVNRRAPGWLERGQDVQAYLDHFGVWYQRVDLCQNDLPRDIDRYALVILAHPGLGGAPDPPGVGQHGPGAALHA